MRSSQVEKCRRRRGRSRTVRERPLDNEQYPLSPPSSSNSFSSTLTVRSSKNDHDSTDATTTSKANTTATDNATDKTTADTTSFHPLDYSFTSIIIILTSCIIFSMIATLIILHQVGYEEEVQDIMKQVIAQTKKSYHGFLTLTSRSSFFLSLSSLASSLALNSERNIQTPNIKYHNTNDKYNSDDDHEVEESYNQAFEIYDLNYHYLPPHCKEKDALLLPQPLSSSSTLKQGAQNKDQMKLNNDDQDNKQYQCQYECQNQNQCRNILTSEMKKSFDQDGVIAIRGLLSTNLLQGLNESSHILVKNQIDKVGLRAVTGKQFFMNKMGAVFLKDENRSSEIATATEPLLSSGFQDVALSSLIPQVAAELLNMEYNAETAADNSDRNSEINRDNIADTSNDSNLRMLRDVLLVKDADQFICGWHVDDLGFWPTTAKSPGINAWIAIDDMSISTGGNFAVSVGTHKVPWRHDIYELTGSTTTIPEEGYKDVEDMFQNRKGAGTCNIKNVNRTLHDKLEERMRVYDLKAGDILFLDRWIFHRTIPFDRNLVKQKKKQRELDHLLSRRYSIRYAPGTAKLPRGYSTELSILWNKENQGRTLDAVELNDAPWYPQCWPHSISSIKHNELTDLIDSKMPVAEARRKEKVNEMKPFLQRMGKQQRDQLRLNARNAVKDKQIEF